MSSKLILMSGPTESGKGEAYKYIRGTFNAKDGRVKARLHELASAVFKVPVELWEEREGKETPHPQLRVLGHEYWRLGAHIRLHDSERHFNNVRTTVDLSPRQALIYVSEVLAKPLFGQDYFGRERLKLIAEPGLYACDSAGGFPHELDGLVARDTLILQIVGRGEFKPSDSRTWATLPGAYVVAIDNRGTVPELLTAVGQTVEDWLATFNVPACAACGMLEDLVAKDYGYICRDCAKHEADER